MTTKEFIAIEKRLLASFPGFVTKGALMFIQPLNHTLRGFQFEPSAFSKKDFYVNVFFLPLCIPTRHVHFTFGHRLARGHSERWSVDQPDLEVALRTEMQKDLSFLTNLSTPKGVMKALEPFAKRDNPHSHEALAYVFAQADEVKAALDAIAALLKLTDTTVPWQQEVAFRAQSIRAKLLADPEDARRQLTLWETETINNLGLGGLRPNRRVS